MYLADAHHMRNILLCLVGAIAITGCAAHESSWRVRDQHGWPVQTWDAERLVVVTNANRCRRPPPGMEPLPHVVDPNVRPITECCEVEVSLNSWGPRAARCGGRREVETVARTTPPATPPPPIAPPSVPRPAHSVTGPATAFHR